MSRFPLTVEHYMSSALVVIDAAQPVSDAIRLLREHDVRHLPVLRGNHVAGILGERELQFMRRADSGAARDVLISDVMSKDPYTVEPDEPVDRVARELARRGLDAALVTHGRKVLGIFTTTDALLALAALVEDDRVPDEPERAARPGA